MHDLLATGKPFPMQDIGIDGIYRLSQSAAVQREVLEADKLTKGSDGEFNNRLSKIVRRHSFPTRRSSDLVLEAIKQNMECRLDLLLDLNGK